MQARYNVVMYFAEVSKHTAVATPDDFNSNDVLELLDCMLACYDGCAGPLVAFLHSKPEMTKLVPGFKEFVDAAVQFSPSTATKASLQDLLSLGRAAAGSMEVLNDELPTEFALHQIAMTEHVHKLLDDAEDAMHEMPPDDAPVTADTVATPPVTSPAPTVSTTSLFDTAHSMINAKGAHELRSLSIEQMFQVYGPYALVLFGALHTDSEVRQRLDCVESAVQRFATIADEVASAGETQGAELDKTIFTRIQESTFMDVETADWVLQVAGIGWLQHLYPGSTDLLVHVARASLAVAAAASDM